MEGIQRGLSQHWGKAIVALIVLAIIVAYTSISSMDCLLYTSDAADE